MEIILIVILVVLIAVLAGAFLAVSKRVGELKQEADRLRKENESAGASVKTAEAGRVFLEKIINSVADPIFVKDRQHRYSLVNDADCEFFGHTRAELIGKSDADFFPEEQVKVFWAKDDQVFRTGQQDINEEVVTDATGKLRTIVTKKAIYTDAGGDVYIVGIVRDITERKAAEEEIRKLNVELEQRVAERTADLEWTNDSLEEDITKRRSVEKALVAEKERLVVALRSVGDGVVTTDAGRHIQIMNHVAETMTGWTNDEAINRPLEDIFRLDEIKAADLGEQFLTTMLPRGPVDAEEIEGMLTGRDGVHRKVLMKISPIRGGASEVVGLVIVFRESAG